MIEVTDVSATRSNEWLSISIDLSFLDCSTLFKEHVVPETQEARSSPPLTVTVSPGLSDEPITPANVTLMTDNVIQEHVVVLELEKINSLEQSQVESVIPA